VPKPGVNVYTKGACSSLKTLFEDHIAVKKGLKPDPAAAASSGPVVRTKVLQDLPSGFRNSSEKKQASILRISISAEKFSDVHILFSKFGQSSIQNKQI
jgi:hypothetical protein